MSGGDLRPVPVPRRKKSVKSVIFEKLSQSEESSRIYNNSDSSLNDINNKTPSDNNDVPNLRETNLMNKHIKMMQVGEKLELDIVGRFTNSLIKSSDSLDNNCLLNDSFGEVIDRFEAHTVSRKKNEFMYENKVRNRSFVGYYSEYFDVGRNDMFRAERCIAEELASLTDGVGKLIDYFESGVKSDGNTKEVDVFQEVQMIREKEKNHETFIEEIIPPPDGFQSASPHKEFVQFFPEEEIADSEEKESLNEEPCWTGFELETQLMNKEIIFPIEELFVLKTYEGLFCIINFPL